MRILLYSRDFLPSVGGVQTIVAELARGLTEPVQPNSEAAVALTVVTETPSSGREDEALAFPVVRRPTFLELTRLIRRADVVHLAGPAMAPLILSLLARKPVVVEHHGFQAICPNGQLMFEPTESTCTGHFMAGHFGECLRCNRKTSGLVGSFRMLLLTPLRRWLCNLSQINITPTRWLACELKLKRQKVVLHGVHPPEVAPKARSGPGQPSYAFGYQGRLVSTKGIRVLLRAFGILCNEGRPVRLVIIGAGPEEHEVRAAIAKFGEKVQFIGEASPGCLEQILAEVDAVVMPSVAGEVFGLVAAENMMRGKLLIVSDLGSLKEVVGNAALVFPSGDTAALADCMRKAMDDVALHTGLAAAARVRSERLFSRKAMVQEHLSVYQQVLESKRGEAEF